MQNDVKLTDLEQIMIDQGDKMPVIIDETYNAETFFKYKGKLIDIANLKLKQDKGQIIGDNIDKEIRQSIRGSLFSGEQIALFLSGEMDFNLIKFFNQFKWFEKSSFFKIKNLHDKEYLKSKEILRKDEDKDVYGNLGSWFPNKDAKMVIIITCMSSFLKDVKVNFPSDYFEFYVMKD